MAWSGYQKFLAIMMVVTGSINTLSTKWADKLESKGSTGEIRPFDHPFLQVTDNNIIFYYVLVFSYIVHF